MIAEDANIGALAAVIVAGEVVLRRRERGPEVVSSSGSAPLSRRSAARDRPSMTRVLLFPIAPTARHC